MLTCKKMRKSSAGSPERLINWKFYSTSFGRVKVFLLQRVPNPVLDQLQLSFIYWGSGSGTCSLAVFQKALLAVMSYTTIQVLSIYPKEWKHLFTEDTDKRAYVALFTLAPGWQNLGVPQKENELTEYIIVTIWNKTGTIQMNWNSH